MPTEGLISIIDDDEDFREAIAGLMKSRGFTVEAFPFALPFLSCPNVLNTSCLIVDVHMPRMTGIELHGRLVERKLPTRDLPVPIANSIRLALIENRAMLSRDAGSIQVHLSAHRRPFSVANCA